MRRLEVTTAGKWYLALTILLGVVAINSGNNVIYLIESMLLSGLILSGVLSELSVASLQVHVQRQEAFANAKSRDRISLHNRSRFYLFCIEVGEWREKKFVPLAFVPRVPPRATIVVNAENEYADRGQQEWSGFVIATMYPFGFARKLRVLNAPGKRIVWPSPTSVNRTSKLWEDAKAIRRQKDLEVSEGDIRQFQEGDDPRLVIWSLSGVKDAWFVRERKQSHSPNSFYLDLSKTKADVLESEISALALQIEKATQAGERPILIIKKMQKMERFAGRHASLDALALVTGDAP
jgi:uncharacterized protein (DUF58 family)